MKLNDPGKAEALKTKNEDSWQLGQKQQKPQVHESDVDIIIFTENWEAGEISQTLV